MSEIYRLALIGASLGHSISPWIHYDIMDERGIEGIYELIEINSVNFDSTFFRLLQGNYHGLNITLPYKKEAVKFMDKLSPEAEKIGAINTVKIQRGMTEGYNTDYHGFITMIEKNEIITEGKKFCVLGTGGASAAVIYALKDMGASDITVVSRMKSSFLDLPAINYEQFSESKPPYDILINCTPLGMFPRTGGSPLKAEDVRGELILDLIYNPEETLLMSYAREKGIRAINGMDMLKSQAEKAWKIWEDRG